MQSFFNTGVGTTGTEKKGGIEHRGQSPRNVICSLEVYDEKYKKLFLPCL